MVTGIVGNLLSIFGVSLRVLFETKISSFELQEHSSYVFELIFSLYLWSKVMHVKNLQICVLRINTAPKAFTTVITS